tara:strand:+ start:168 stop:449 length:282 start_codon:yes stop_codon:yes gene_type:complete
LKNKNLFQGVIASFFASSSTMIFILLYFSEGPIEDVIVSLFQQKKLGGLISIGALINLPLFFLGIHKRKTNFAKGVMITSIIIVMMVAILKII